MRIVQLMASPFYGGPERQMLGMSRKLPADCETIFLTFGEGGKANALVDEVRRAGLQVETLTNNFPRVGRCVREIEERLRGWSADIVCTSGYKPDILGWRAARAAGMPIAIVSHGWTGATWKVRMYERIDRWVHARADVVISVSEAQATKVRAAGVPAERMTTIVNAVSDEAFAVPDPTYGDLLRAMFRRPAKWILGAAGRLSPEKGFEVLVEAAKILNRVDVGVVVFGEGPMRADLEARIQAAGLQDRFVLAGFRSDVGRFLPHLDVGVLPSHTEGLPVVLLEMLAAARPVVATAVGGTPEVITDGATGWLTPPNDAIALAAALGRVLDNPVRDRVGVAGRERVRETFSVARQADAYRDVFERTIKKK